MSAGEPYTPTYTWNTPAEMWPYHYGLIPGQKVYRNDDGSFAVEYSGETVGIANPQDTINQPSSLTGTAYGNFDPPESKNTPLEAKFDALLKILSLSPEERGFLNHLAQNPDQNTLLVFADWLEEHGKEIEADRMRRVKVESNTTKPD